MSKRDGLVYGLNHTIRAEDTLIVLRCPRTRFGRAIPLREGDYLLSPLIRYTRTQTINRRNTMVDTLGGETMLVMAVYPVDNGRQEIEVQRGVDRTDVLWWNTETELYCETKEEYERRRQAVATG